VLHIFVECRGEIEPLKKIDNLEIEADIINTQRDKNKVDFRGNVVAKHANNNLEFRAVEMNLKYAIDRDNKVAVKKLYAFGNVVVKRGKMTITGNEGLYDIVKNEFTMKDEVTIFDDISKARGDAIVYDIEKDNAQIFGGQEEKQVTIILEDSNKAKETYGKQK
jgi:lipopolysaccharide transport protein LptA